MTELLTYPGFSMSSCTTESVVCAGGRNPREPRAAHKELLRSIRGASGGLRAGRAGVVLRPGVGGAAAARPQRVLLAALLDRTALRLSLRAIREAPASTSPSARRHVVHCSASTVAYESRFAGSADPRLAGFPTVGGGGGVQDGARGDGLREGARCAADELGGAAAVLHARGVTSHRAAHHTGLHHAALASTAPSPPHSLLTLNLIYTR